MHNTVVGEVALFPYNFTPQGFLPCTGSTAYLWDQEGLFQVIGTRFGGDGKENFKLPDMSKSAPEGSRYVITATGIYPNRGGSRQPVEAHTGEIRLFPYDFVPDGWELCDGGLKRQKENVALFSLLGNTFGGDPAATFALPDLSRSTPPGMKYCICVSGVFPPRP